MADNLKIRIAHALGYCGLNPDEDEKKTGLKNLNRGKKKRSGKRKNWIWNMTAAVRKMRSCIREDVREKTFP